MESRTATSSWFLPTLSLLFFLSGISGLIYQALWLRQLALIFGVTIYAASTVLASFMAGLALGSFLAGRLVDRARNPLLWYGAVEVLIGLSALATPLALDATERSYAYFCSLWPHTSLAPLTLARFLFSSAVLIVPTTLMGATLPIVVKSSLLQTEKLGERISFLYASNTAGAIAGAILAGFYLIGGIGIAASFKLAAALNLLVGIAAIAIAPAFKRRGEAEAPPPSSGLYTEAGIALSDRSRRLVLLVFAISGFISLALEVVWFRVLVLFLEVTTYAFTIMLATFLCGITVGSYLVALLIERRLNWLILIAVLEIAIAILCPLSLTALAWTPKGVVWAEQTLPRPFGGELSLMIVASFLAVFPITLLMGVAFPIGLRVWTAGSSAAPIEAGRRVGIFYSLNVFGSILGSLVAGFLLVPGLGSRRSLIALGALSLMSGILLLLSSPKTKGARALSSAAVGVVLFVASAFTTPDPFALVLAQRYPGENLLWREEEAQGTVSVHERADGARVLYVDGRHLAESARGAIRIHRWIGDLPLLAHDDPKEVLVIGLGGGVTAGTASRHAGVNVDVIELSEAVVRGSDWFKDWNNDVLRQPNVHLRIDDGRNFMMLTPKRYDVITADIIQPVHAGAGNLYSVEYFRLAYNILKDDGLMLQWIDPGWSDRQYKLVMRTFLKVFPHATLWHPGSLMIGAKQPLLLDPASFERKLQVAGAREAFGSRKPVSFNSLLSLYVAGPEELHEFVGPGLILTDDRPLIEYFRSIRKGDRQLDITNLRGDVMRHVKQ